MAFDNKHLISEMQDQYLADDNNIPWIVGFSGGKDSTMMLQLVWYAVKEVPKETRWRDIYVVCNNTLVENPKILDYTEEVLKKIEGAALEQSMPVKVVRTTPKLEESFWVNLIGRGYPAPNNTFRWCTERLKINPTTEFIKSKVGEVGEAIILLGTRKEESATRAKSMRKNEVKGSRLRRHVLPNAYVYAPIAEVAVSELWLYLNQMPSPWGADNKKLNALYRNANSGDCPLVIDDTTPSCGNSRFGCWVCTVVKRDKSMEAFVDHGEDWMEPLLEFREMLVEYRNDPEWRMNRRKNGQEGRGPYKADKRALMLQKLLEAQKEIRRSEPKLQLINHQELVAIQIVWHRELIFDYNVADIYNQVFETSFKKQDFNDQDIFEKDLLKDACKTEPDHFKLINEMLELQKARTMLTNNYGLHNDLENRLEKHLKEAGH